MTENKDAAAKGDDTKATGGNAEKTAAEEYNYTLPTSQKGLQTLQSGAAPESSTPRSMQVAGNDTSAYLGVSPEYANYANEVDKPSRAGEGSPEKAVEDRVYAAVNPVPVEDDEDADAEEPDAKNAQAEEDKKNARAQVTSTTHQASRVTAPKGKQQ